MGSNHTYMVLALAVLLVRSIAIASSFNRAWLIATCLCSSSPPQIDQTAVSGSGHLGLSPLETTQSNSTSANGLN